VKLQPATWLLARFAAASLRVRVLATAAVLVTITSALIGFLGTTLLHGYLLGRDDAQLNAFGSMATRAKTMPPIPVRNGGLQLPSDFLVEIVGADGGLSKAVVESLHHVALPRVSAAQLHRNRRPFTAPAASGAGHSWRVLVRPIAGSQYLIVALNIDDVNSTVTRLALIDTVAGAAGIVLLAAVGLLLIRVSLAPLARIEDTAEAIASGDLSQRIAQPSERTEVGRLAAVLNTMLGRIEAGYRARSQGEAQAKDSEERMRRFVADASHELRTPLTSIRGLAEFGLQQGTSASHAELTRLIAHIQQEAARMGLLVEDLLLLAQLDQDRPLDLRPVELASIVAEAVQAGRAIQPRRPITLLAVPDPVIVDADDSRLRQVIDNLISNALRHTPAGTPVTITVGAGPGHGSVTVADSGPGMTAGQASRVFERFYRTDRARSRSSGGTGLGLSIAAALVAAHHGTISLDTRPGYGAAFRVTLPLASPGPAEGDRRAVAAPQDARD
jgi:two-component system, OmpR family, sensor kinase